MQICTLDSILEIALRKNACRVAIAAADDEHVMEAIEKATKLGLIAPIFIGRKQNIIQLLKSSKGRLDQYPILEAPTDEASAILAAQLVQEGKADALMKGLLPTSTFLKGILQFKDTLLRAELLSHLAVFELDTYHKLLGITDAALNISPTLGEKIAIAQNALAAFRSLGVDLPKIAFLSAVEQVSPKIISTIEAERAALELSKQTCIAEGPLALDNAISKESAEHKGISSQIAGDADILVLPDLVSGNVLYKSLNYFAKAKCAAVVLGAKVPVILTSRSDSSEAKLYSIALAVALSK